MVQRTVLMVLMRELIVARRSLVQNHVMYNKVGIPARIGRNVCKVPMCVT